MSSGILGGANALFILLGQMSLIVLVFFWLRQYFSRRDDKDDADEWLASQYHQDLRAEILQAEADLASAIRHALPATYLRWVKPYAVSDIVTYKAMNLPGDKRICVWLEQTGGRERVRIIFQEVDWPVQQLSVSGHKIAFEMQQGKMLQNQGLTLSQQLSNLHDLMRVVNLLPSQRPIPSAQRQVPISNPTS